MSNSKLSERAAREYLKKLAKDRLRELRLSDHHATLATALLAVARDNGFSNWRALKTEVEQRQIKTVASFFRACAKGDVEALRDLLADAPSLSPRMRSCSALLRLDRTAHRRQGSARRGRAVAARARHGSEFREAGDNTYALHWAATHGDLEVVRAPLDAGGGVHGFGDVHGLEVIGWATVSHARRRFDGDGCLAAGPRFAPHRTRCPPPHLLGDVRRRPGPGGAESGNARSWHVALRTKADVARFRHQAKAL